jgi:hypothetical protein
VSFLAKISKFWAALLLVVACGYFAAFNHESRLDLRFPPWIEHISVSAWIGVLIAFLLGAVVASLIFGVEHLRRSLEIRRLTRQLADARTGTFRPTVPAASPRLDRNDPLAPTPTVDPAPLGRP